MEERKLTIDDLSDLLHLPPPTIQGLMYGRVPITDEIAFLLSIELGSSTKFWIKREKQYREQLAKLAQPNQFDLLIDTLSSLNIKYSASEETVKGGNYLVLVTIPDLENVNRELIFSFNIRKELVGYYVV